MLITMFAGSVLEAFENKIMCEVDLTQTFDTIDNNILLTNFGTMTYKD